MIPAHSLSETVKQIANEGGFDLAGIAPVRAFAELAYFPEWIDGGHAGEMEYLKRRDDAGSLKRASLESVAPWARSVIVCAMNYNTAEPYSTQVNDAERGWISRYAWSREDYHDAVLRRLRAVESRLAGYAEKWRQDAATTAGETPALQKHSSSDGNEINGASALQTRCYVDTGPLVERVYAKYAGVGWIGKNTCILNQKMGSWLFLGVILTSLELTPDLPAADRCGTCTRCLEACPTDAFIGPYQLDSNKCISYLTIEKRGSITEDLREGIGLNVFGCDICQDVCPWNRKAPATALPEFQPRAGLVNPALDWLAELQADEFREVFRGSPIRRTKINGLRRNALIAMGNSGYRDFLPALQRLGSDPDPVIAESAQWASRKLKEAETDGNALPSSPQRIGIE